jgi:hypothetical protein
VLGWGEIEIKAKLSPAEAGVWAELGKIITYKDRKYPKRFIPFIYLPKQPKHLLQPLCVC